MAGNKIIAVIGATGAQGGGLVRAILQDPAGGFAARAITRKASSDAAKSLAKGGAEVVEADLDDVESLKKAFTGAHGAFCVTNFWEHFSPEKEQAQARHLAEAARAAGVKHVVWSTLEDTRRWVPLADDRMPTLGGKWKVPHFDSKGESDAIWRELGVPTTLLLTSFYWDNFIAFPLGDRKMPGIAASDIGACAYGIFKAGDEYIGKTVGIAGEHLSGSEMAAGFSRALGKKVAYVDMAPEAYRALGFPGAEDLGNMFQFKRDFEKDFRAARSVEKSRGLNPKLQSFEQWLAAHAKEIPLA